MCGSVVKIEKSAANLSILPQITLLEAWNLIKIYFLFSSL